jgi:hypothetical protein
METTLLGTEIDVRAEQNAKAPEPILITVFGSVMVVRE